MRELPSQIPSLWGSGAWARRKADSALGSLTDCLHPEAQPQDGGDQREISDPSGGIVLLSLNELPSPGAPAKLLP